MTRCTLQAVASRREKEGKKRVRRLSEKSGMTVVGKRRKKEKRKKKA